MLNIPVHPSAPERLYQLLVDGEPQLEFKPAGLCATPVPDAEALSTPWWAALDVSAWAGRDMRVVLAQEELPRRKPAEWLPPAAAGRLASEPLGRAGLYREPQRPACISPQRAAGSTIPNAGFLGR